MLLLFSILLGLFFILCLFTGKLAQAYTIPTYLTSTYPGSSGLSGAGGMFYNSSADVMWVTETTGNRVNSIKGGVRTIILGAGASGDASSVALNQPTGVWVEPGGSVFVAQTGSKRVTKLSSNGLVSNFAGTGNAPGGYVVGDGGQATSANIWANQLCGDNANGNLFVTDLMQNRIRKIAPSGIISTFAGTGDGYGWNDANMGNKAATSVPIVTPVGVFVHTNGVYFTTTQGGGGVFWINSAGIIVNLASEYYFNSLKRSSFY